MPPWACVVRVAGKDCGYDNIHSNATTALFPPFPFHLSCGHPLKYDLQFSKSAVEYHLGRDPGIGARDDDGVRFLCEMEANVPV
jgi:hypothetical protein